MDVIAKARFVRTAPRKVRLVIDAIRGKDVTVAQQQLRFMNKWAAVPVLKLLDSAVANAEHNFKMDPKDLVVKSIVVDGGPVLKRFTPKAMGRATVIRKRTSHISIVLCAKADKPVKGAKAAKAEAAVKAAKAVKKAKAEKPAAKAKAEKKEAKATK